MVELLTRDRRAASASPKQITHPVKFYEKGDKPLEIVTTRQWYIRNGGRVRRPAGRRSSPGAPSSTWHPDYMRHRYDNWVERPQRRLARSPASASSASRSRSGTASTPTASPTTTTRSSPTRPTCPIDPQSHVPAGYTEDQRDQPGGFIGDPDIMDTWATSSLTPQIACGWEEDPDLFARTFPMDLRPQAHDIIRTWLFSTVVRSHYEHGTVPWAQRRPVGLDPRPRPQEDVEVEGQRRRPRSTCSSSTAPTPSATGPPAAAPAPTPPSTPAR